MNEEYLDKKSSGFTIGSMSAIGLIGISTFIFIVKGTFPYSPYYLFTLYLSVLMFLAFMTVHTAREWERSIILRFGRYSRTAGPGLYITIPFVESINKIVDVRRRSTAISTEGTLTGDGVSVTADAVVFWQIMDVKNVVLNLVNYNDLITKVCKTSLREAISENPLEFVLGETDKMDERIRSKILKKTEGWGIGNIGIEIRDISIPKELADVMSRRAQAERERQARIVLAEAEVQIANKTAEAALVYEKSPGAMELRRMGLLFEMGKNQSTIVVPTDMASALLGISAANLKTVEKTQAEKTQTE